MHTLLEGARPSLDGSGAIPPLIPIIPGYDLVRIVGKGGMGIVWEAIDQRLERRVAIKVHAETWSPERIRQLWSEARLAARVSDPGVVAIHDLGTTQDGTPYYSMEYVEGTDLRAVIKEGPLAHTRALTLALEITRAVSAAHERGIVHRDLKPANIIVDLRGRPRILDFGIAIGRFADGTVVSPGASHARANDAAIIGTPAYMAPEQIDAKAPGTATDIHAIGVILYEMLTGDRPFSGGKGELVEQIRHAVPPPPSSRAAGVHADTDAIVAHCLEKSPGNRPTSSELAEALSGILEGRPDATPNARRGKSRRPLSLEVGVVSRTAVTLPASAMPTASHDEERDQAPIHIHLAWLLDAPPSVLWPYVSDTDRVNKASGLEPVAVLEDAESKSETGGRLAVTRLLGAEAKWREFPFEWVRERELAVSRRYETGPLEALWNRVTMAPSEKADGQLGTALTQDIWIRPRAGVDPEEVKKALAPLAEAFAATYRHIDAFVAARARGETEAEADPFEPTHVPTAAQESHVQHGAQLLAQRGFDAGAIDRLTALLLRAPEKRLERLRPYALADEWRENRDDTLELFLNAANVGLLDLVWDMICPSCMVSHESLATLADLRRSARCTSCSAEYERELVEGVEVVFRPHPAVRDAKATTYCLGSPALRPHVLVQQRIASGEKRSVAVAATFGEFRATSGGGLRRADVSASAMGFMGTTTITIGDERISARPLTVRTGEVELEFVNETNAPQLVRFEVPGHRADAVPATAAMTDPAFTSLFGDEHLPDGDYVAARRMAFVFVGVDDQERVFRERGDAGAWHAFKRVEELVGAQLEAHRGVLLPSPLAQYTAAFGGTIAAANAAIDLHHAVVSAGLEGVRIALHEGPCIALTRRDKTEYFGETLHRGAALLDVAPHNGVAMSSVVASDRAVMRRLLACEGRREVVAAEHGPYAGARVTRFLINPPEVPNSQALTR
jgi:serine/threonine protein kinase